MDLEEAQKKVDEQKKSIDHLTKEYKKLSDENQDLQQSLVGAIPIEVVSVILLIGMIIAFIIGLLM